jgi:hypothetical protein
VEGNDGQLPETGLSVPLQRDWHLPYYAQPHALSKITLGGLKINLALLTATSLADFHQGELLRNLANKASGPEWISKSKLAAAPGFPEACPSSCTRGGVSDGSEGLVSVEASESNAHTLGGCCF